jgi:hypothetical protein
MLVNGFGITRGPVNMPLVVTVPSSVKDECQLQANKEFATAQSHLAELITGTEQYRLVTKSWARCKATSDSLRELDNRLAKLRTIEDQFVCDDEGDPVQAAAEIGQLTNQRDALQSLAGKLEAQMLKHKNALVNMVGGLAADSITAIYTNREVCRENFFDITGEQLKVYMRNLLVAELLSGMAPSLHGFAARTAEGSCPALPAPTRTIAKNPFAKDILSPRPPAPLERRQSPGFADLATVAPSQELGGGWNPISGSFNRPFQEAIEEANGHEDLPAACEPANPQTDSPTQTGEETYEEAD